MKKKEIIILFFITTVAFLLRVYLLRTHLFFGPEQGRDFLVIRDIVENHKMTLIGSKTDIDGIFHGPFYYYLAAIPFALSEGNPFAVSLFLILLQSITVFPIFLLGFELTGSKRAGYLGAILYAVSFGAIAYARWLSNPPLSIPLSVLFFLFFLRFVQGKKWFLMGVAVVYGLLGQAEFINYYIYGVIVFSLMFIYRRILLKADKKIIVVALIAGSTVSFFNIILFDIRHKFLITQSLLGLLSGKSGYSLSFTTALFDNIRMFIQQYTYATAASSQIFGRILLVATIGVILHELKKNKHIVLLIIWIIVPPLSLALLRHNVLEQLYVGLIAGYILSTVVIINWFFDRGHKLIGVGVISILLYVNLHAVFKNLPSNLDVFFQNPQPQAYYGDQLAIIDWVHEQSNGRPYSIQVYTIPYFWQDHWDYLFWYKRIKDQVKTENNTGQTITFVITQKDRSNPLFLNNWYDDTLVRFGKPVRQFEAGEYIVEERERHTL